MWQCGHSLEAGVCAMTQESSCCKLRVAVVEASDDAGYDSAERGLLRDVKFGCKSSQESPTSAVDRSGKKCNGKRHFRP